MSELSFLELAHRVLDFNLFTINQTPITIASLVLFIFFLVTFTALSKLLARMLGSRVFSRLHIDDGIKYTLERVIYYTLTILGVIVAFQFIGIDLSGLAFIFGLLSVGIGFGLQNVTSNFVSGLILLFERPIKIGDRVTVGDTEGDVLAINMRSTTIQSLNNIAIIVPNSEFISQKVTNWSYGDKKIRLDIDVGVSYLSDLDAVLRCLREVALENDTVLKKPEPAVLFIGFSDSSWNMQLRCWIVDPKQHWTIRSEINCSIIHKFRENSIEIPYPQRDLHLRSSIAVPFAESG